MLAKIPLPDINARLPTTKLVTFLPYEHATDKQFRRGYGTRYCKIMEHGLLKVNCAQLVLFVAVIITSNNSAAGKREIYLEI